MPPRFLNISHSLYDIQQRKYAQPRPTITRTSRAKRLVSKHKKSLMISERSLNILPQDVSRRHNKSGTLDPGSSQHKDFVEDRRTKNYHANGEVTAVPNPIPDTGFRPTQTQAAAYPGSSIPIPPARINQTSTVHLSSFTPLPPLLSLGSTTAYIPLVTTTGANPPLYTGAESVDSTEKASGNVHIQPHKISTPVIVLLAVGLSLLLAGLFILCKIFSRPVRRARPIPSLPILDDPFSDNNRFDAKESPIFGGKERLSPQLGSNSGLWAWSQYPRPVLSKNAQATTLSKNMSDNPYGYGATSTSPRPQGNGSHPGKCGTAQYYFAGHSHSQSTQIHRTENTTHQTSTEPTQNAWSRTAKRVSAASVSLYAASPQPKHINTRAGRVRTSTAFTADGHQVMERTKIKPTSNRNEPDPETLSKTLRYSQETAYDGAAISSPAFLSYTLPQSDAAPSRGGRTRIKSSYYAPGAYPRVSELPSVSSSVDINNSSQSGEYHHHRAAMRKSDSHRDRDTQALTFALGLSSPVSQYTIPSPQPTLYPEDSLSVVESRRPRKPSMKRNGPTRSRDAAFGEDPLPVITTALDGSAALGSLMLIDTNGSIRPEQKTQQMTATSKSLSNSASASPGQTRYGTKKASSDKAPSIPLPPPLPSLAQMGLEHANPQAYADYRSPTYSIYGLYESERKSTFMP